MISNAKKQLLLSEVTGIFSLRVRRQSKLAVQSLSNKPQFRAHGMNGHQKVNNELNYVCSIND